MNQHVCQQSLDRMTKSMFIWFICCQTLVLSKPDFLHNQGQVGVVDLHACPKKYIRWNPEMTVGSWKPVFFLHGPSSGDMLIFRWVVFDTFSSFQINHKEKNTKSDCRWFSDLWNQTYYKYLQIAMYVTHIRASKKIFFSWLWFTKSYIISFFFLRGAGGYIILRHILTPRKTPSAFEDS